MNEQPQSIQEVEAMAGKWGITLTPDDYQAAQELMNTRRAQLEQVQAANDSRQTTWAERFNRSYPIVLRALHGIGDVSITLVQTFLVGPGVMISLLLALIVEVQTVQAGISMFDVTHSALGGFVLVLLNLVLELLISWIDHKSNHKEDQKQAFSLRLLARWFVYFVGFGRSWTAILQAPSVGFRWVLKTITVAIFILALAGSMTDVIRGTTGNWREAIQIILVESSLYQMVMWIGGLAFRLALVFAAQALVRYAAKKAIEIAAILSSDTTDKGGAMFEAVGATGAAALFARLKEKQKSRRLLAASAATYATEETIPIETIPTRPDPILTRPDLTRLQKQVHEWLVLHPEVATLTHGAASELITNAGIKASESTIKRVRGYMRTEAVHNVQ